MTFSGRVIWTLTLYTLHKLIRACPPPEHFSLTYESDRRTEVEV